MNAANGISAQILNIFDLLWTWLSSLMESIYGMGDWIIFPIDNNPITLSQLLKGGALLLVGHFILKKLTGKLEVFLYRHLEIRESIAHAISVFCLYFCMIILFLFTLVLLNIPITIFTVIGGGVAFIIGFGSQNIMYNFLSGLFVIFDQPVRPSDIVEVDGLTGEVERIGSQATRIKSIDNTHIMVPNRTFVEKNIINWTLTNPIIRREVKVGVVYGSPTDQVKKLLLKAVDINKLILKRPKPLVFFNNFGDNSLEFSVAFWIHIKHITDLQIIPSQVRYRVDQFFRENDIVIAFPQQDIHFRNPLRVKMENKDSKA